MSRRAAFYPGTKYDYVVIVSSGNDVYGEDDEVSEELYGAIRRTARLATYLCCAEDKVLIVFGGSAATWRYSGAFAERYDKRVAAVLEWCHGNLPRIRVISGATELASIHGVDIADHIGHLKYDRGFPKLLAAVHEWCLMAHVGRFLSKL